MKKHILTAVLCMALSAPVFAQESAPCENCTEVASSCTHGENHDACAHGGDHDACAHGANHDACAHGGDHDACAHGGNHGTCAQLATAGDEVPESVLAGKMTQAEKAHNAAVNDSWGGAITIIAMVIVISALAILSILFLIFGKISKALISKNKKQAAQNSIHSLPADHDHTKVDSGEVIAAIAMALTEHFGEGHDMEETILTIRRLNRAYSPWNSKLYNLRQLPQLNKPKPSRSAF